jgi:hypothetical protein
VTMQAASPLSRVGHFAITFGTVLTVIGLVGGAIGDLFPVGEAAVACDYVCPLSRLRIWGFTSSCLRFLRLVHIRRKSFIELH